MNARTIIVGGGISGLAAAHQLHQQDDDFVLLEASRRLGGKIASGPVQGCDLGFDVDCAADGFLAREPEMSDLCRELGLGGDLVSPACSGAFIWVNQALRPIPASVLGVPVDPDALLGAGIVSDPGIAELRARGFADHKALVGDSTVGEVVRARAGDEVFERLVDPLLGGINAGNADNLSICAGAVALADAARKGGSFLEALRAQRNSRASGPVFHGVKGGTQRIIEALQTELNEQIILETPAVGLAQHGKLWRVATPTSYFEASRVIITTPSFVSAKLLEPHCREAAWMLSQLPYADVAVLTFVVRREHVSHNLNGAGFLVPRDQGMLMTACSWSSSKWAHYNDGIHAILRVSVGRIDDRRWLNLSEPKLVATLREELAATIGLAGPSHVRVTRWPQSLPQYFRDHLQRCDTIDTLLQRHTAGVSVSGAALRGLGLPACVRQARQHAAQPQEANP
ncbi:MAG: protoporphyrinogen oxidase [Acidimicrobiia bacterium]|nr:protoporphyrinogen oxidase [Acidimicrobiia bacterium]MCY4458129.1 protoporphyrinogen oxidase [Acidimicrobiaceae bacterium]